MVSGIRRNRKTVSCINLKISWELDEFMFWTKIKIRETKICNEKQQNLSDRVDEGAPRK